MIHFKKIILFNQIFPGLTFTERWNTDNTLGTEIAIQDQIAKGLKLSFDSTFAPQTG
jgi:voltage-dependent anion channel protein 2